MVHQELMEMRDLARLLLVSGKSRNDDSNATIEDTEMSTSGRFRECALCGKLVDTYSHDYVTARDEDDLLRHFHITCGDVARSDERYEDITVHRGTSSFVRPTSCEVCEQTVRTPYQMGITGNMDAVFCSPQCVDVAYHARMIDADMKGELRD